MSISVKAPLGGVVVEVAVAIRKQVCQGQLLAILESMKVQIRIEDDHASIVSAINAELYEPIERVSSLFEIDQ